MSTFNELHVEFGGSISEFSQNHWSSEDPRFVWSFASAIDVLITYDEDGVVRILLGDRYSCDLTEEERAPYSRLGEALGKSYREQEEIATATPVDWQEWCEPTGMLVELFEIVVAATAGVATKELVSLSIRHVREFINKLREDEDEEDWRNPGAYF